MAGISPGGLFGLVSLRSFCASLYGFSLGTDDGTRSQKHPSTRVPNVGQGAIPPQLMQNPTPITGCLAPSWYTGPIWQVIS
jgi:hypothetical protein